MAIARHETRMTAASRSPADQRLVELAFMHQSWAPPIVGMSVPAHWQGNRWIWPEGIVGGIMVEVRVSCSQIPRLPEFHFGNICPRANYGCKARCGSSVAEPCSRLLGGFSPRRPFSEPSHSQWSGSRYSISVEYILPNSSTFSFGLSSHSARS